MKIWKKNLVAAALLVTVCVGIYANWSYTKDQETMDLTQTLNEEKLLSEGVIQSLRENKYIALQNISKICELLDCQPADLLEYQKEADVQ